MKIPYLLLAVVIATPNAFAQELRGKVEFTEPCLKGLTPTLAEDPDASYKAKLSEEIRKRTQARLRALRMTPEGSIEMHVVSRAGGAIESQLLSDNSVNVGLVSQNVVRSLDHSSVTSSSTRDVLFDLKIETIDSDQLESKFR